jgi:hypothetical protein
MLHRPTGLWVLRLDGQGRQFCWNAIEHAERNGERP